MSEMSTSPEAPNPVAEELPAPSTTSLGSTSTSDGSAPDVSRARRSLYLLLSLAVLVLDQGSKWMVEAHLPTLKTMTLIPGLLNFVHVRNTGVAFGLFPAHGDQRGTLMLAGLGFFALSFVLYYFFTAPQRDRVLLSSLALVIGGAVGNLIDRLASGGVTDFIDFHFQGYHWHTFNVADSAITIGICLMILSSFRPAPGRERAMSEVPPSSAAG